MLHTPIILYFLITRLISIEYTSGNVEICYAAEVLWKNPSFSLSEKQGDDGCLSMTTVRGNHGDCVSKISKAELSVSIQYSFLTYVTMKKNNPKLQYQSLLSLWKDISEE